jgi:hypothetical protein
MLLSPSPVYHDLTRPNVNKILANLIYFYSIGSQKYIDESTTKYTQDEMVDEIIGPIGGQAVRHYQPC